MTFIRSTAANLDVTDRTNAIGAPAPEGSIVADGPTGKSFVLCDVSDKALAASRPMGIVYGAAIPASSTGTLRTVSGTVAPVLLVAGLTVVVGDEVIVSTTPGSGTLSKTSNAIGKPTASPEAINRVGVVEDVLTYDGGADLLVSVQLDFAARRGA